MAEGGEASPHSLDGESFSSFPILCDKCKLRAATNHILECDHIFCCPCHYSLYSIDQGKYICTLGHDAEDVQVIAVGERFDVLSIPPSFQMSRMPGRRRSRPQSAPNILQLAASLLGADSYGIEQTREETWGPVTRSVEERYGRTSPIRTSSIPEDHPLRTSCSSVSVRSASVSIADSVHTSMSGEVSEHEEE